MKSLPPGPGQVPGAPRLTVVVPCLNEEEVLPDTHRSLCGVLQQLEDSGAVAPGSRVLYVDDGSTDSTWETISSLGMRACGISLARNYGHQEALLAGLEQASLEADILITIDADLQDDVSVIPLMVGKWREGADVVYGIRRRRRDDSFFKRTSARAFYGTMRLLGAQTVSDHADFRLMSARAVADLLEYGERNLFLRGLMPLLGYRQDSVFYDRRPRIAGRTKYPLSKMMDFAADGITSFSVRPVRMLFWIGVLFLLVAIVILCYVLIRHFSGHTIEGWTSLMLSVWFCTGTVLIGLGIIGEYVGKVYIEVKRRPRSKIIRKF